jgi:hypothetical protein
VPTRSFIKGLSSSNGAAGEFVGEDADLDGGMNGIRVGDGYHNCMRQLPAPFGARAGAPDCMLPVFGTNPLPSIVTCAFPACFMVPAD